MDTITRAKRQRMGGTMFGKARHPEVAEKISIESPRSARASVDMLKPEVRDASYEEKLLFKRSFVLAANRAAAQLQRKNLSASERGEMRAVEKIYRDASDEILVD